MTPKFDDASPTYQHIRVSRRDGVAVVELHRPDAMHAIDPQMLDELHRVLRDVQRAPEVTALLLTGSGPRAFSAGADIEWLSRSSALEVRAFAQAGVRVTRQIEELGKLSVAAINGVALGGGLELAESCMLRVAAGSACLGHPEVAIGAIAGFGGTTRLPRLIGKGRAAELLLSGRIIDAAEALQIGLVGQVCADDDVVGAAEQLLRQLAARPTEAVALTWEALHRGLNLTLDESIHLGADFFGLVASTEAFRHGTRAFIARRRRAE
jgi:enoyl-CoA hydratase